MRLGDNQKYQPQIIKLLLENDGEIKKSDLNKKHGISNTHPVYAVLKKKNIINNSEWVTLLDYEHYCDDQKKILKDICDYRIHDKHMTPRYIQSLIFEFGHWLSSIKKFNLEDHFKINSNNLNNLIEDLHKMDKNDEFQKTIMNKLILNFKPDINYYAEDYFEKTFFNYIYDFKNNLDLEKLIAKYENGSLYNILKFTEYVSPIFFYLTKKFPIINDDINTVYTQFGQIYKIDPDFSINMKNYIKNISMWDKIYNKIRDLDAISTDYFQVFCYWFNAFVNKSISITYDWNEINFPNYEFNNNIKFDTVFGLVILLDELGTKINDKNNAQDRLTKWSKLVYELRNRFVYNINDKRIMQNTRVTSFSDNIMITIDYSRDTDDDKSKENDVKIHEFLNIVGNVLGEFMINAIKSDVFLRGCISYGKYSYNEYSTRGAAVIEAGSYYEIPNWVGVSLTTGLYSRMTNLYRDKVPDNFVKYDIPTHQNNEHGIALNIPKIWKKQQRRNYSLDTNDIHDEFKDIFEKKISEDLEYGASIKFRNTLKFLEETR